MLKFLNFQEIYFISILFEFPGNGNFPCPPTFSFSSIYIFLVVCLFGFCSYSLAQHCLSTENYQRIDRYQSYSIEFDLLQNLIIFIYFKPFVMSSFYQFDCNRLMVSYIRSCRASKSKFTTSSQINNFCQCNFFFCRYIVFIL